jgi:hypothetical protein
MMPLLRITEQDEIREQLDRILASRLFRNSQRFPDFLRYTVEHALKGDTADIKERTLGIKVFARNLDYDTSTDPVVRVTAAEVRKRLAQYYQIPGHDSEPRIDFPRGSYVPVFDFSASVAESAQLPPVAPAIVSPQQPRKRWQLMLTILASCTLASAFVWSKLPTHENAFDRFWGPIEGSSSAVMLCIPDLNFNREPNPDLAGSDPTAQALASFPPMFRRVHVGFADMLALSTVSSILGRQGHAFYIRRIDEVQLQDLQETSAVLIGDHANWWASRLGYNLRFSFAHEGKLRYISDSQNPSFRQWSIPDSLHDPAVKVSEDFGIISRVFDPTTGHLIVMSSGITGYATGPAAECLADAKCLGQAEKLSPGDWKHKNIQIIIGTAIVGDNAGQPSVVAAYLW